jgi:hypothetical protein
MNEVYRQTLMEEIQNSNFVSIQADETTDISYMSQFVILLQYVKRDGPVERLHSFVKVQNRTAEGLASSFKTRIGFGCSVYPQGCNCRHSEIQLESNRVVCISEKSKRAISLQIR